MGTGQRGNGVMSHHRVTLLGHVGHDPDAQNMYVKHMTDQIQDSRESDIQLIRFLVAIHQVKKEEIYVGPLDPSHTPTNQPHRPAGGRCGG